MSLPNYTMVIEMAYNIAVRPGWTLQPRVEYIIHPCCSGDTENALIAGLRNLFNI